MLVNFSILIGYYALEFESFCFPPQVKIAERKTDCNGTREEGTTVAPRKKRRKFSNRSDSRFLSTSQYKRASAERFGEDFKHLLGPVLAEFCKMQIRSRRKKQARYSPYQINLADQLLKGLKRKGYRFLMKYLPLPSLTTMERFKNKYYFWQKESYVHLMNQDNQNSSIDSAQTVSVDSEIVKQEKEDLMFIENEETEKLVSNKNNKSESV